MMPPKNFRHLLVSLSGLLVIAVLAVSLPIFRIDAASSNTGFLSPSANAPDSGGDGDGYASNPTRAYSDNASFAVDNKSGSGTNTSCTNAQKDKHRFFNYGISIPSGATVQGIEVRLDALTDSNSGSPQLCVQLSWDGGVTWTAAKTTSVLTTREVTYTLGSSTDTWGRGWDATQLNNTNFRVRVINVASNVSRNFSLDWVAVKVHYDSAPVSPLPTSTPVSPLSTP